MSEAARKFLVGLVLFVATGGLIGWLYGQPGVGLVVAAVVALVWQVRQLLAFERALRTGDFHEFQSGEGLWQQIYSKFSFEHQKAARCKKDYRLLLREIRNSTNAMPDGAVVLDEDNEIVVCNRAAKALVGLKRKKDRGQRVDNILRDPELTRLLDSDDPDMSVEIASPVVDGNWVNCRVVPYGVHQKLLLIRDVTERLRLSKMRRDFIANASHELRSPLTVISGYLDALSEDKELPAEWSKPVGQMQGQAKRMRQILGDLLELSRLESAGPANAEEPVDVVAILDDAKQVFEGHAEVATIDIDAEPGLRLSGNASEIETVIVNLLSNAVRYTPPDGRITMTWKQRNGRAEFSVADTGEGIDPDLIPRLTERFFRVERGRSRRDGGTGLGLAIVKHVLARHDAELIIESAPGEGSVFRCLFPKARVTSAPPAVVS